jgi:hypothetical protein
MLHHCVQLGSLCFKLSGNVWPSEELDRDAYPVWVPPLLAAGSTSEQGTTYCSSRPLC